MTQVGPQTESLRTMLRHASGALRLEEGPGARAQAAPEAVRCVEHIAPSSPGKEGTVLGQPGQMPGLRSCVLSICVKSVSMLRSVPAVTESLQPAGQHGGVLERGLSLHF